MAMIVKVAVVLFVHMLLVVLVLSPMRVSALANRRAMRDHASHRPGAPISPEERVDGVDGHAPRAVGAVPAVPYRTDLLFGDCPRCGLCWFSC